MSSVYTVGPWTIPCDSRTGNGGNETPDHVACIHRLQADLSMALAELEKEHALTSQKEIAIVEHEALIRNYEGQVCDHSAQAATTVLAL